MIMADEYGRAFAIGISLNLGFVLVALYDWQVNSLALLADAGHNLNDVAGLILAWVALIASRLYANERHTYGGRKGSILASFFNASILLLAMGSLGWESIQSLQRPEPMVGETVMLVAGIGVVINAVTAWLFISSSRTDLNLRGAFLHMAADALVSVGVVLAGLLYFWQGWQWNDPVLSLLIAAVIVFGTWSLFRQSLHLMFDGVPEQLDLPSVRQYLLALPGVCDVHDLYVWAMSSAEIALTAHMSVGGDTDTDGLLRAATQVLHERFDIDHSTIQLEHDSGCQLSC